MIHYFVNPRLFEGQHGHRMGRGALTCWKQIIKEVIPSRFIYEFDYKKFHDLIDRKWLAEALLRFGFPEAEARKLVHLSSPYVKGADERDPLRLQLFGEDEMKYHHYYRGVIQGSNIAALLGLIVLEDLKVYYLSKGKYVGYADDGILYGDDPKVMDEWLSKLKPEAGVEFKPEKSGWVKYDGEWKKTLKFVGLRYDGLTDLIRADTHSGKTSLLQWELKQGVSRDDVVAALAEVRKMKGHSGSASPQGYSAKTLTHRNGMEYLGMLTSLVWGGRSEGYIALPSTKVLVAAGKSLIDLYRPEETDLVNASTFGYMALQQWLLTNAYRKERKVGKRTVKSTGQRVFLGGLLRPTSTVNRLGGENPSLPIKMDLLPTNSKEPTPRWLTPGEHHLLGMGEDYLVLERFMLNTTGNLFQFDLECLVEGTYKFPKSLARKSLMKGRRPGGPGKFSARAMTLDFDTDLGFVERPYAPHPGGFVGFEGEPLETPSTRPREMELEIINRASGEDKTWWTKALAGTLYFP